MTQRKISSLIYFYLRIISVWVFAWILFYLLRMHGIDEFRHVQFAFEPNLFVIILIHISLGVPVGILYASFELIFDRPFFQKRPYIYLILIKMVTYMMIGLFMITFAIAAYQLMNDNQINWAKVKTWWVSKTFFVGLMYMVITSMLITLIRQTSHLIGPGVIWNLLIGKYHHPKEEEKIFMFLDLKSSTSIAEKLGHYRFSSFMQDCFKDLSDAISLNDAEIYKYVGDEVILSWKMKGGIKDNNCLSLYFDYKKNLNAKKEYYEITYGIQPVFKAGIHYGKVTIAEVGIIKKEIPYYGDVLNTAARIQGRCNEFSQELLISQDLKNVLSFNNRFNVEKIGVESLRGKQEKIVIFSVGKMN